MLARHWRMLTVFAGGCLSGGMLIVGWRDAPESSTSSARRAAPQSEPLLASATADDRHAANPEPSPREETASPTPAPLAAPKAVEHPADPAVTESGRSVAEVLLHLEAAYRQTLEPAAPAVQAAAPLAEAAAPTATAPAPVAPVPQAAPVALVAAVAPVAAPAGLPAQIGTATQVGIATQNVHVGDVHNGDSYQVQQIVQYVPMYAPWAYGGYGAYAPPTATPPSNAPKRVPYPSTLTNPDNPWGYNYPSALWTVR